MEPFVDLHAVNVHLGRRRVLANISWSLHLDRHWAIVGPNGSGKTTLLRVIAGTQWIDPDGGTRTYSPDGLRRDVVARAATWIRYVHAEQHERYARLNLAISGRALIESGFDNSVYVGTLPTTAQSRRVDCIIEEFALTPFANSPIRTLSTGQLRRLLIARALVAQPRVVILDEFTNGLDRAARHAVLAAIERLAPRVALVIASHRTDDIPIAITDTLKLEAGRIVRHVTGRPESRRPRATASAGAYAADAPVLMQFCGADVYRGRTLVLENVNWKLGRAQHTVIRGANGAGKSTFARLIAGTIAPATGAIVERFGAAGPFDVSKLKARVAHLSDDLQTAYDQAETVEAVVASGFPASIGLFTRITADEAAVVEDVLDRIGLHSLRGRVFTELSFGERRKVLIARSLIRRPEILILDEVGNGLDARFGAALRTQLVELVRTGTTLVMIAHDDDLDLQSLIVRECTIADRSITETMKRST